MYDKNANPIVPPFFFQVVFASSSPFLKSLLESGSGNCECEALTVHLPDFSPATVKNLLGILYTGRSMESNIFVQAAFTHEHNNVLLWLQYVQLPYL